MTASRPSLRLNAPTDGLTLGIGPAISQQQQQQQQQQLQQQQPLAHANDSVLVMNVCHTADCLQHHLQQQQMQQEYQQQQQTHPQPFIISTSPMLLHPHANGTAYMPHKEQQQRESVATTITPDAAATQATAVKDFVKTSGEHRTSSANSCCPAPMFIILISLLEIGVFIYDYLTVAQTEVAPALATPLGAAPSDSSGEGGGGSDMSTNSFINPAGDGGLHIPSESVLIYRPDRRLQLWRFVSYMFLHANWLHLAFNVSVQTLYGLPLELQHGSLRVALIYLAGVCAGSLGTSVIDANVYLVGASGGVYALLAAQLANVLMNYGQMRYSLTQLMAVCIFVACDLGYALYAKYAAASAWSSSSSRHSYSTQTSSASTSSSPASTLTSAAAATPTVSYIAHLTGALAGFTMGLLVLRPCDGRGQSTLVWWLALSVYAAFTIFAIAFNLLNTMTAQLLEEEGEELGQHLLHDLGIS